MAQKLQGFQDLLKLTKTGTSICGQVANKKQVNKQLINKYQSSKTVNGIGSYNNEYDYNKFDDIQTDQGQLKKLNKMVYGITQWQCDKQKQSVHVQRKINYSKTNKQNSRPNNDQKINKPSAKQVIQQRKLHAYTSADSKKFRKFYTPMKKYQAKSQLNQINSQFIKTSANLIYPKTLIKNNLFSQNEDDFKELRNRIKKLQNKAKKQYGISFQSKQAYKKGYQFQQQKSDSCKQNQEYDFNDLQLGPILAKQFPNKYKNYHKMLEQQNINNTDSSVPKNLIDIIKNKGQSYHLFSLANTKYGFNDITNEKKMKKRYHQRPKTFKPTYTYIRI